MKHRIVILSLFLLPLVFGIGTAQAEIRTGLWETTVSSELEGMPFAPPPVTFTDCLTEADLVPDMGSADQHCDQMEHDIKGSVVSWRMRCRQDGMTTSGQGEIRFQGDSYRGEMRVTIDGGPMGEMKMTQTMQGRRLGNCP